MYHMDITVEGTGRGLLMHKFGAETSAQLESAVKKTHSGQPAPEIQAENVAYRAERIDGQPKGQLVLPGEHFLGAITASGSGLQIQGKGKKTFKGTFQGALDVEPFYVPLTNVEGQPLFDFEIDSRPVRIKATQGRIIRHRPLIRNWRASFKLLITDDSIPPEVLQAAVEAAGRHKCVGDYRPRYGQFRIVSCTNNKDNKN